MELTTDIYGYTPHHHIFGTNGRAWGMESTGVCPIVWLMRSD